MRFTGGRSPCRVKETHAGKGLTFGVGMDFDLSREAYFHLGPDGAFIGNDAARGRGRPTIATQGRSPG